MLTRIGITVALFAPALAFAAYNDVTLTTGQTIVTVGGVSLTVTGSDAVIESITVNESNFSFTLLSGSSLQVASTNRKVLSTDAASQYIVSNSCSSEQSVLKHSSTASESVTITITPSSATCTSSATSNIASGGSGGSSPSTTTTSSTSATTTSATATTTPATQTPAKTEASIVSASGLSTAQIQAILDVLASFDADADIVAKVKASLEGVVTGSATSAAVHAFRSNLTIGSLGSEVKALQEYLNARGYIIAERGPGSPGNETNSFGALTKAALMKFQKANGITPASGYFGPKTRAFIASP